MKPVERELSDRLDGVKQSISDGIHLLKRARNYVELIEQGGDIDARRLRIEIDEYLYLEGDDDGD